MKTTLFLIFISLSGVVLGQLPNEERMLPKEEVYPTNMLTEAPCFSQGNDSLASYLSRNLYTIRKPLKYKNSVYTIYVQFIIDLEGTVSNTFISSRSRLEMREADIELVYTTFNNMPRWIPGKIEDKPVKARVMLPITF